MFHCMLDVSSDDCHELKFLNALHNCVCIYLEGEMTFPKKRGQPSYHACFEVGIVVCCTSQRPFS